MRDITKLNDRIDRIIPMPHSLRDIMERIHRQCLEHGGDDTRPDYLTGASVAGFQRVARAMLGQGII